MIINLQNTFHMYASQIKSIWRKQCTFSCVLVYMSLVTRKRGLQPGKVQYNLLSKIYQMESWKFSIHTLKGTIKKF